MAGEHIPRNIALVLATIAALFVIGTIVEDVGFGAIVAMVALGVAAAVTPFAVIRAEEGSLPFGAPHRRR